MIDEFSDGVGIDFGLEYYFVVIDEFSESIFCEDKVGVCVFYSVLDE